MYLAWFDANPKKPVAQKIAEAHERYVEKFGRKPLVCLVNPEDVIQESAVELRPLKYIGRNCFWIGVDDLDPAEQESSALATPDTPRAPRTRKSKATSDIAINAPAIAAVPEALSVVAASAPRTRKPKVEPASPAPMPDAPRVRKPKVAQSAPAVAPAAPEAPSSAPRNRKTKAVQEVTTIAPVAAVAPEALPSAPRSRKPKAAPAAPSLVHAAPAALSSSPRGRKPKAAPVAPPAPTVAPAPTIVPAPKRRTRREKAAA
jgi:hypothetical protein